MVHAMLQSVQAWLDIAQASLGIDIYSLVNTTVLLFAFGSSIWSGALSLQNWLAKTFFVSVVIDEEEPLYTEVLRWMHDFHFKDRDFLSVRVTSTKDESPDQRGWIGRASRRVTKNPHAEDDNAPLSPPSFKLEPHQGSQIFVFDWRLMYFKHTAPTPGQAEGGFSGTRKSFLEIQCVSMTLRPIRQLLHDVQVHSQDASVSLLNVCRPIEAAHGYVAWRKLTSRPARPMSTIIMDKEKKEKLLSDIEEYLRPQTKHWYANHGIPYRRGYLFSGPPGTGKTSLASAIAGFFGADIYVASLQDPALTESNFQKLLSDVPSRSIVLLEDIDVVGAMRTSDITQATPDNTKTKAQPLSLSSLLNAVDGVSSQEGRILMLSTNHPETLDKALTRPGRVHVHVHFELPSKPQIVDLFLSIYSEVDLRPADSVASVSKRQNDFDKRAGETGTSSVADPGMIAMADDFAERIPQNKFSVADLQGYLLNHKGQPKAAMENLNLWLEGTTSELKPDKIVERGRHHEKALPDV